MKQRILAIFIVLVLCFGLCTTALAVITFSDVPSDAWYSVPVEWAINKGITNGTGDNKFSPFNTCTQAQILTFLWRSLNSPEPTISNPFNNVKASDYYYKPALWAYEKGLISDINFGANTPCTRGTTVLYMWILDGSPNVGLASFGDVPENSPFTQAVAWAVKNEITNGTSKTTFSPNSTCTRAQIVTFLLRFVNKLENDAYDATYDPEKVSHYNEYPTVPDFGIHVGVEMFGEPTYYSYLDETVYAYDNLFSSEMKQAYIRLLINEGFTEIDLGNTGNDTDVFIPSDFFKKDNILVELPWIESDRVLYFVTIGNNWRGW